MCIKPYGSRRVCTVMDQFVLVSVSFSGSGSILCLVIWSCGCWCSHAELAHPVWCLSFYNSSASWQVEALPYLSLSPWICVLIGVHWRASRLTWWKPHAAVSWPRLKRPRRKGALCLKLSKWSSRSLVSVWRKSYSRYSKPTACRCSLQKEEARGHCPQFRT